MKLSVFRMAWSYTQPRSPNMLPGAEYYMSQAQGQPFYGYNQLSSQYLRQPQWPLLSDSLFATPHQQPFQPFYQPLVGQYYQQPQSASSQYYQQTMQPFQYAPPSRRNQLVIQPPAPKVCRRCRGTGPWDALFCCWCGIPLGY